ncbi:DUF2939 domain-containing protein [Alkanindiges sp. WGS2144]|uniref:DUF2939 domain-containing protein n=1 Tax=Alkanindiges sp. WGS2144 TaxID=3366808 RepID=UPI003751BB4F
MKKLWAAVLVCLAFVIWQVAGPYYTVYQIKQAVEQQNEDKLAQHVDFVAVRQNLKTQFREKLQQRIEQQNGSFFGLLALNTTEKTFDLMLKQIINPSSLILYIKGQRLFERELKKIDAWPLSTSGQETEQPEESSAARQWQAGFEDFSTFQVQQQRPDGTQVNYVLTRSGLDWKLSNIVLP